jgi:hypothetical protein
MKEVHKKVAKAAEIHGKTWGRPVADIADAEAIQELGARCIVLGSDFGAIYSHLASLSSQLNVAFGEPAHQLKRGDPARTLSHSGASSVRQVQH